MVKNKKSGVEYAGVSVRLICHKCGQSMRHEIAKVNCEYCDHSLGMFPRVLFDDNDKLIFEVIV